MAHSIKTVLVVDDNVDLRETLREILNMEGYAVSLAEHGRDALEQLQAGAQPHAILLDLMMPVMDGAEFLTRMRADPQIGGIPVLLVTAFADRARGLPANLVLGKPIDVAEFLEAVSDACHAQGVFG